MEQNFCVNEEKTNTPQTNKRKSSYFTEEQESDEPILNEKYITFDNPNAHRIKFQKEIQNDTNSSKLNHVYESTCNGYNGSYKSRDAEKFQRDSNSKLNGFVMNNGFSRDNEIDILHHEITSLRKEFNEFKIDFVLFKTSIKEWLSEGFQNLHTMFEKKLDNLQLNCQKEVLNSSCSSASTKSSQKRTYRIKRQLKKPPSVASLTSSPKRISVPSSPSNKPPSLPPSPKSMNYKPKIMPKKYEYMNNLNDSTITDDGAISSSEDELFFMQKH